MTIRDSTYALVARAIEEVLEENQKPRVDFDSSSHVMRDLALDSLNLALLIVKLEERTGKDPFREGFREFQTVGELVRLYESAEVSSADPSTTPR